MKKLLVGVLLLAAAYWAVQHPYVRWRIGLIGMKLSGELPQIAWGDIPHELTGSLFFENATGPDQESTGLVVLERQQEGECGHLWKTPIGSFWGRKADERVLEWLVREQYFWSIYQNTSVSVQEGDVVFDLGGHLGMFTRTALNRGVGKVVVFEPEPTNIDCFKKTFEEELADSKVVLVEAAAWSSVTTLTFTQETGEHQSARARVSRSGEMEVPATTVDATVAQLGLQRVDFIKMDIEGSETHALRGGADAMQRFRPQMALCIYHRSDDGETIPRTVMEIRSDYEQMKLLQYAYFY